MAEADLISDLTGVSDSSIAPRFFCHSCNSDIENVTPVSCCCFFMKKQKIINFFFFAPKEYTCPQCSNGFVEELPPPAADSSSDVDMMETESYTVKHFHFFHSNNVFKKKNSSTGFQ